MSKKELSDTRVSHTDLKSTAEKKENLSEQHRRTKRADKKERRRRGDGKRGEKTGDRGHEARSTYPRIHAGARKKNEEERKTRGRNPNDDEKRTRVRALIGRDAEQAISSAASRVCELVTFSPTPLHVLLTSKNRT